MPDLAVQQLQALSLAILSGLALYIFATSPPIPGFTSPAYPCLQNHVLVGKLAACVAS